jgi:hypothetical protein
MSPGVLVIFYFKGVTPGPHDIASGLVGHCTLGLIWQPPKQITRVWVDWFSHDLYLINGYPQVVPGHIVRGLPLKFLPDLTTCAFWLPYGHSPLRHLGRRSI